MSRHVPGSPRVPGWLRRVARAYLTFEDALDDRLHALWRRKPQGRSGKRAPAEHAGPGALRRAAETYLAIESRLDRILLAIAAPIARAGRAYDAALRPLRVRGPVRLVSELAGEAATIGAAGLVVLLALALPAFKETEGDWLKRLQLAVTFLDRDGREIGHRGIRHDDRAALASLPPHVVHAVIDTEDRRFYQHWGIDPVGLFRAISANTRASGYVQGGSTLTQQLAKNVFLTNERSLERKIKEAFLAVWLEVHFSKAEILQLYLDRTYMGAGTFGIGAAAETYFGKPVQDLSVPEAAMLAGLFKAPSRYAPHMNPAAAQARAAEVVANMVEMRDLTPAEGQAALAHPAAAITRAPDSHPDYYLDWAFREVEKLAAAGRLGPDTVLTVRTPLDSTLQAGAEAALDRILEREGPRSAVHEAALVVMDPRGGVHAMVGGRDYADSQFNRATEARRQPGSAFKPFVYATALTYAGYRPDSVVTDSEICIGRWCPHNYGRSHAGAVPLWLALAKSINTIPVKLSIGIGRALIESAEAHPSARDLRVGNLARRGRSRIVEVAHRMGLRTPLPDSASLPIGAAEVTVLDMTSAYAVFANGGTRAEPSAILEVRNSRGRSLYRRDRDGVRPGNVLPESVVAEMNTMLAKVPEQGTGRRAALAGLRSAGKTGTTNAYRDAWYVGFTGDLVAGVWFGNDDYTSTRGLTGGGLPAQAWHDVMAIGMKDVEPSPIPGLDVKPRQVRAPGFAEIVPAALTGRRRGFEPARGAGL